MSDSAASPQQARRTPEAIEADIDQARQQLVATLAQLKAETAPAALAQRGMGAVKGIFVAKDGSPRIDRIAIAVGVVGAVVGISILRSRRHR